MRIVALLLTVFAGALTAGCAVGPDFERPAPPDVKSYGVGAPPDKTAAADSPSGAAQTFAYGQDLPGEWWTLFHSEPLNGLIAQAFRANPDLAAAQASLRVASENAAVADSILFPSASASFNTSREKLAGAAFGGSFPSKIFTLHNASVSVSYGLDIFGGSRRAIEELGAEEEFRRFEMEATYSTLAANVVTAAVQEASLRGQIDATRQIIEDETKQLDLLQQQLALGGIAKAAVLAEDAALQQVKAALPPLEQQLAQTRNQLTTLTGQFPSDEPKAVFDLASLTLPGELPVSLPSKLVEQRPDVRAAEASLHAASAAIGVAAAARLPQFTLTASDGSEADNLGKLFTPGTGIWNLSAGVAQTLFDAGALRHKQRAAEADYDLAAAQYRKTVLAAFQDVADTLHALQSDAETLHAQAAAEKSASDSLKLVQEQFDDGAVSYLNLLAAQQAEQQARLGLVQAEARRYADTAALFQALGGGWWNRELKTEDKAQTIVHESWWQRLLP